MMIVAVFRSRTQSMDYAERLKQHGVFAEIVPAPKEARIGCGLCVRFDVKQFIRAKAVMHTARYSAFKGYYRIEYQNGQVIVFPYNGNFR